MAKIKPTFNIRSYGIYSKWDSDAKALPQIQDYTLDIPAEVDVEFGFILNVKKGRGAKLCFCIHHPNIPDEQGIVMPPFSGEVYVDNNDWDFFLGDTIWPPIANKEGDWRVEIRYSDKVVAEKVFDVSTDHTKSIDEYAMLNRRVKQQR